MVTEQLPGMPLPPPAAPTGYNYDVEIMFTDGQPRYWYGVGRALFSQDGSWIVIEHPGGSSEFVNGRFVDSVYSEPVVR